MDLELLTPSRFAASKPFPDLATGRIWSISGGKDSTATLLYGRESGMLDLTGNRYVFADTGNEHDLTYDYVRYLADALQIDIDWVKADFSKKIEVKAKHVREKWPEKLLKQYTEGRKGYWKLRTGITTKEQDGVLFYKKGKNWVLLPPEPLAPDLDVYQIAGLYKWLPTVAGVSELKAKALADEKIELALSVLVPTGNPFLDMCLWKGRFPSTRARFCTDHLKIECIDEQVTHPMLESGEYRRIESWQGVRADESFQRRDLPLWSKEFGDDETGEGFWVHRPIIKWTAEDVFAMHKRHGIKPNPLYLKGMGRVGCMPCINARKDEFNAISKRFPEVIERLRLWEQLVSEASRRGSSTFFPSVDLPDMRDADPMLINHVDHGVDARVRWAATDYKSKKMNGQQDLFLLASDADDHNEPLSCSSIYGLCG